MYTDIFNQFQSFLRGANGDFQILEHRVPVEKQMEYFKYADRLRRRKLTDTEADYDIFREVLENPFATVDSKKNVLVRLALSKGVKAFRIIEQYAREPEPELADWAHLALTESRIAIESELLDEKHIYISTGLGGRNNKLRFFGLMSSEKGAPFLPYQKDIIEKEFAFAFPQYDCEIERVTVRTRHVELVFLAPINAEIRTMVERVMIECNQYGDFLAKMFTLTNVKELDDSEIAEILKATT
ncbi:MAG: hypothetical protein LBR50_02020 [Tannerella sp.]|jgi:hypothetical protein|nr:hypothetical protein [Tannerella sp.]